MQQRVKTYNPKRSESTEQQQVVGWFRAQYPDKIIFAIPNAQKLLSSAKNRFAMQRVLAREGLTPGVSDLFIAVPTHSLQGHGIDTVAYHGLFLEMKAEGKTQSSLSSEQVNFIVLMREQGYQAHMAAGFEQAKAIIEEYLK